MDRRIKPIAAVLTALVAWLAPLAGAASAEVLNKIVLRVNDRIATLYDYRQRRDEALQALARQDLDQEERRRLRDQAGELVFKDLYEELLLLSRADQLGVDVSEAQVDAALAEMREGFGIKTDEEFQRAAAQSGLTIPQLRDQVQRNLKMRGVLEREVYARVNVDEEDLRRYYSRNPEEFRLPEQVRLQEVVVLETSALDPAGREQLARQLRQELGSAGATGVAEVVARHAGEGTTSNLIDLGWVDHGDLAPELERAAWDLAPGAVSEPVPGRGGLHLIQMVERRPSRVQAFAEVSEQIARKERNRVYQEEMIEYMKELQEKSLVVSEPPAEAAGYLRLLGTEAPGGVPAEAPAAPAEPLPAAEASATPDNDIPQTQPTDSTPPGTLPEPKPIDDTPPPAG